MAASVKGKGISNIINSTSTSASTSPSPPPTLVSPSSRPLNGNSNAVTPSTSTSTSRSPSSTSSTTTTDHMRRRSIGATPTQSSSSLSYNHPATSLPSSSSSSSAYPGGSTPAVIAAHLPLQQQHHQHQHHNNNNNSNSYQHQASYNTATPTSSSAPFHMHNQRNLPVSPLPGLASIPLPTNLSTASSSNSHSNNTGNTNTSTKTNSPGISPSGIRSHTAAGIPLSAAAASSSTASASSSSTSARNGVAGGHSFQNASPSSSTMNYANQAVNLAQSQTTSASSNHQNTNRMYNNHLPSHPHHSHHLQSPNMNNYTSGGSTSHQPYIHNNSNGASNANSNNNNTNTNSSVRLPRPSETFTRELSNVLLHTFVPSVLPTPEEYQVKESARKYLEYLADRVTPGAKLLPFGSQANGMALRNSDMDLCYISPPGKPRKMPSELVELLGRMIEVEAPVFAVQMLSRARIPIIKLSPSPIYHLRRQEAKQQQNQQQQQQQSQHDAVISSSSSPSSKLGVETKSTNGPDASAATDSTSTSKSTTSPSTSTTTSQNAPTSTPAPPPMPEYGLSCDIGFENRLALENTRLVLTYAMTDPRLRTIVLFLKVWTKRRKINNPYLGTLSSYGYVLLVVHFLINVRKPSVLPNLQRLRPMSNTPVAKSEFEGRDIYFFDDLDVLPRYWQSTNRDNVGELLIAFFHYYHKEFRYAFDAVSIRSEGGIVSKASKGWMADQAIDSETPSKDAPPTTTNRNVPRDLNRLCIEDPFQTDYNVARTVTVDGLFTIRGEIARATGILRGTRSDVNAVIAELLEEREDYLVQAPPPSSTNRRRSAPSPRLQPSLLATHNDFRNWALANGVPHAQGGNIPLMPNQLQGNPLGDELAGQATGLSAANIEALARYQQASQALSQANLQQQQAQQQQLVANIPALLASTGARNSRSAAGPRRFHEHSYRPNRQQQTGFYTAQQQQQHQQHQHHHHQQHQQQQSLLAQQLYASQQQQQIFQNQLSVMTAQMLHPDSNTLSPRSADPANSGTTRGPRLDRRSSWDGSAASDDNRQPFRNSSSASEAAVGDLGTTTAPTSPAMHNGNLPAFASRSSYQNGPASAASPTLSTMSISTAPAGSYGQYGGGFTADRQSRGTRGNASYGRSPSQASGSNGYVRPPRHSRDDVGGLSVGMSLPMQPFPTSFPPGQQPGLELAGLQLGSQQARGNRHISNSSAVSLTSADASLANSPLVSVPVSIPCNDDRDPVIQSDSSSPIPSPSSIRFGNFDAALYSSEPAEMAGLGLFETISSSESSPSGMMEAAARLEMASIPDDLPLPPPIRLPPQPSANFVVAVKNAQRFKPQLADIPASPAVKGPMPNTRADAGSLGRRPSLQNGRRRSAGDEAALGLRDVTFFGNIPVNKSPNEREKAMAALLKENSRDTKIIGNATGSKDANTVNDSVGKKID